MQLDKNDSSDDELKKMERLLGYESAKGAYPVDCYRRELES
jgi:hypothetical protein